MNPFAILLIVFLMIPVLEIYLLIQVGGVIGAMPTVILVVFTAVMGAWLLRIQGFSTLQKVKKIVAAGGIPAFELIEGLILLIAGALLLTPGFFTDAIGFLCLMPALRRVFLTWVSAKFMSTVGAGPTKSPFSRQDIPKQPGSSPFARSTSTFREENGHADKQPDKQHSTDKHSTDKKRTEKPHNVVIEGEFQRDDDDHRN